MVSATADLRRERLIERLRSSAARRVTVVAGPAGAGKSTLIAQALDGAGGDVLYRVPSGTQTLLAFIRGLVQTLEKRVPGAHLSLAIAYERAMQSPVPALEMARWLGEHLRGSELRIIVDDLQFAAADGVAEFLRRSIDAAPGGIRWLIATRDAESLPLATWLAHGLCDVPIGESDLRFTPADVAELAAQMAPHLTAAALATIGDVTAGNAAALALALRLGGVEASDADREAGDVYDTLAGRIVDALDEREREDLLQSAVRVAAEEGDDRLFRAYLARRLHARGPDVERAAFVTAAEAAERAGDLRAALALYQRAGVCEALSRILASHGVALMDGGFADVVEAAVAELDRNGFDGGAAVMLLKAIRDSRLVRFDSAEAWFQLGIAASTNDDLRLRITHRYVIDLIRRGRVDAIEVLEPVIASAAHNHPLQPLLRATLATAYVLVDRLDDARAAIAGAMDEMRPNLLPALRTRAFQQAAFVALRCADIPGARRYANRVLDVAVPNGFYDLAARAHSILYEIAHAWDARPELALAHVESVADFGLKSGDTRMRHWALLAAYYIEAERGNGAMMQTIERALNAPEVLQTTEETNAALLPGQALRATWTGDFAHAFRLLEHTAEASVSPDRRALRWAELALYGAAAGYAEPARTAVQAGLRELESGFAGKHGAQATAYLLVANSLLRDHVTWLTGRSALDTHDESQAGSAFVKAALTLHRHWFEKHDYDRVLAVFAELRAAEFGGIAAMLEALPADPPAVDTIP